MRYLTLSTSEYMNIDYDCSVDTFPSKIWEKISSEQNKLFNKWQKINKKRGILTLSSEQQYSTYVNVENYFLTIIKHIAVLSSKLEFPLNKVGNSKNADQQKEALISLSLHFWCSLF